MKFQIKTFLALFMLTFMSYSAKAQCDTIATICNQHLENFISDGQHYRALLIEDEIAEFNLTLYGNAVYRIAACSGLEDGNLIFNIYDKEDNLLFTNKDQAYAPYWNFQLKSTIECKIETKLNEKKLDSGCAVLLVGFKQ